MNRELLTNIFYGDEIDNPKALMRWSRFAFPNLAEAQFSRIENVVIDFFGNLGDGVFGGPITAGDATVIATLMEHVSPERVLEFGVASGVSSAFILRYAREMGILHKGNFLESFDISLVHAEGDPVGAYAARHHPELIRHWVLNTEVTSATLLAGRPDGHRKKRGPVLAFVDGGHNHPWPFLDILFLQKVLPKNSWVVLQDIQMMERWLSDCMIYGVAAPAPVRGVSYAFLHWPGTKIAGFEMAYNFAALKLDVSNRQMARFIDQAKKYPYETKFNFDGLLRV